MKKLLFLLLAAVCLPACEKEDEPEGIEGSWTRTESYSVDNLGNRSHNLLVSAPDCQKDDIYEFAGGHFLIKDGTAVCEPGAAMSDTYTLSGRTINFGKLGIWEINSVSSSAMEVRQLTASSTGFVEVITIFKRK